LGEKLSKKEKTRSCLDCKFAVRKGLNTIRCMWWKEEINLFFENPANECNAFKSK